MTTQQNKTTREVRTRLVEVAGRTTQDLGMGRIIGQVLGDIYMTAGDSSLDDIGQNLGLSKAAVSIAARQLESLGLLQRIWKKSDRRNYYRVVDHLGVALRRGILELVRGQGSALPARNSTRPQNYCARRAMAEIMAKSSSCRRVCNMPIKCAVVRR